MDPATLPGGDVALRMLYLRSKHGDLFDKEEDGDAPLVGFYTSTYEGWDAHKSEYKRGPMHWVTTLDCSDIFFWGSADSEEVTTETWPLLEQTVADVKVLYDRWKPQRGGEDHGGDAFRLAGPLCWLYAARVRKQRPQGASYSYFPRDLWPLFDACGPDRATGLGNPSKPGSYKGPWSDYNEKFEVSNA